MKQDERTDISEGSLPANIFDSMRYVLAETICNQNRSRADIIANVHYGDPVWDLTLSLFTAEHFERSTTIAYLSEQSGISKSVVNRCLKYLVEQGAVFENTNQYSNKTMPYLLSEETRNAVTSWLDDCISNFQKGLGSVALNAL